MPQRKGITTSSPSSKRVEWPNDGTAKSKCECGHSGDGSGSQHAESEFGTRGHGPCMMGDCKCTKFVWDGWLPGRKPRRRDA